MGTGDSMSNKNAVLLERKGSVLVITLNRPHVANALNRELLSQLGQAFWELKHNNEIRAAVLLRCEWQLFFWYGSWGIFQGAVGLGCAA